MQTVTVNADALSQVLEAFKSGYTHRVLELQAIQNLKGTPVEVLATDFAEALAKHKAVLLGGDGKPSSEQ